MATSTISNTVTDPSGTAVSGATVVATLMPGPGFRITDSSEIARRVTTTTNGSGAWSLALERTANISPSSSWWEIEEQIPAASGGSRVWAISVGASPATLYASLVTPAANPSLSTYLTQASADARYFAIGSGTLNLHIFSVLDYGAVGDGTTNDTTACQQTITAACAAGGVAYFPPGTYKITSALSFTSGVIIQGAGQDVTTIKGALGTALLKSGDTSTRYYRVRVQDLTIDNTSSATAGGIGLDFTKISQGGATNVAIKNVATGLKLSGEAYYNEFYGLDIIGATTCVNSVSGANENHFFGGRFSTCTTGAIFDNASGGLLSGVAIEGFTTGVSLSPTAATVYFKVTGCRFEGGTTGVLIGALSQTAYVVANQFTTVTTDISDSGTGSVILSEQWLQFGNSGSRVKKHIRTTATVDFGSIAAGATADSSLQTMTGVSTSSTVIVNAPSTIGAGLIVSAMPTTDGVYLRMANVTTGAIDPPSLTFQLTAFVY